MILTSDVGNLFAAMETAYGKQWTFGTNDIGTWRSALAQYDPSDLTSAAESAVRFYIDFPPNLPQFLSMLRGPEPLAARANTYLEPPKMLLGAAIANKLMFNILRNHFGADSATLEKMVFAKGEAVNNLIGPPDEQFLIDLETELNRLADGQDHEAKKAEAVRSHEAFCVRQGVPMPKVPYALP